MSAALSARAGSEAPSLAGVNQSFTMALSRVNSDLITMFSSAAHVFDSRPPSPAVTALLDTAGGIGDTLTEWSVSSGSSSSSGSDSGWSYSSSASDSDSSSWSGGGSSSGGSSGGGGGGFG